MIKQECSTGLTQTNMGSGFPRLTPGYKKAPGFRDIPGNLTWKRENLRLHGFKALMPNFTRFNAQLQQFKSYIDRALFTHLPEILVNDSRVGGGIALPR